MGRVTVTIPQYEELSDDNSLKTYTCYTVRVVLTKGNFVWDLQKRYSSFSNLHIALKDIYPEVEEYDFPNKSMFNTFSEFTKERRRAGFEGFLQLLATFEPLPIEVEEFLEWDKHVLGNDDKLSLPPDLVSSFPPSDSSASAASSGALKRKSKAITSPPSSSTVPTKPTPIGSNGDFSNTVLKEILSNRALQMELLPIVLITIAIVTVFYLSCIYVGLVDISTSTTGILQINIFKSSLVFFVTVALHMVL